MASEEKFSKSVSINVIVSGYDDWLELWNQLTELATRLAVAHPHVNLASLDLESEVFDTEVGEADVVYHDDKTLDKVRRAIGYILLTKTDDSATDTVVDDIINELLNRGILFRERR